MTGKGGKPRIVKISRDAARSLDRYLRSRSRHAQACRPEVWLGVNGRGPLTASGIYQAIARRGVQAGVAVHPHRFRHHFSHTWLARGGPEGDLMELNGWASPQMLRLYGARARSARARRTYDRVMDGTAQHPARHPACAGPAGPHRRAKPPGSPAPAHVRPVGPEHFAGVCRAYVSARAGVNLLGS